MIVLSIIFVISIILFIISLYTILTNDYYGMIVLLVNAFLVVTIFFQLLIFKIKHKALLFPFFAILYILFIVNIAYPKYVNFNRVKNNVRNDFDNLKKMNIKKIHIDASSRLYNEASVKITDKNIIDEFVNKLGKCNKNAEFVGKQEFYKISFIGGKKSFTIFFHKDSNNTYSGVSLYVEPYFDALEPNNKTEMFDNYQCPGLLDLIVRHVDEYVMNYNGK